MENLGEYYHDVKNNAALTVTRDKNGTPLVVSKLIIQNPISKCLKNKKKCLIETTKH